ncbi:hypothetical protein SADUNF_Sadunf14G0049600 [Salix dunnii]|uniref:Uncharacterized protein n=1 Tax=Salix dunnii TaxID=1413687 RepID=A0A835JCX5_9ROSI|nr:hypothetical protein SADUNF_Sadunf14G0049600 [Salix dunnii]
MSPILLDLVSEWRSIRRLGIQSLLIYGDDAILVNWFKNLVFNILQELHTTAYRFLTIIYGDDAILVNWFKNLVFNILQELHTTAYRFLTIITACGVGFLYGALPLSRFWGCEYASYLLAHARTGKSHFQGYRMVSKDLDFRYQNTITS